MNHPCGCSLRAKLVGDGCHLCNPQLVLDQLCERLKEMARECESSDDGTLIPDTCSGYVFDDLMEAARLIGTIKRRKKK